MEEQNSKFYEIDILQILAAIWHRAWIVVLAAIIGAGAGFSIAEFVITPKYKAQVLLYVNNSLSVGGTSFSISTGELTAAQKLVDTYIVILQSRSTLEEVKKKSGVDYSYNEMRDMITASAVNNTEIFSVSVTSKNKEEAASIANVIAKVLPIKIGEVVENSSVRVVDKAVVPASKASPSTLRYTAIGLLLGMLAVCGIIVVRELTDTQIRSEDYLIQTYNLPVLAVIPDLFNTKKTGYYSKYSAYGDTDKSGKEDG
ncbi:MAG: hypothetical protein K6G90_09875 [Clostridia bacterium]|nr:hypothetical protein [Clostridia bacterium]